MYVLLTTSLERVFAHWTVVIQSIPALIELDNWVNSVRMLWDGQLENLILIPGVDPPPHTAVRQLWGPPTLISELRWLGCNVNDLPHIMPNIEKD